MTRATATAIFQTDLAAASAAPAWVELFPAGPEINARDGRRWTLDPGIVLAAFDANRGPLPIDYEHGQDELAPKGHMAPAAGWIVKLEERAGAVWAQVEWTEAAARMIVGREYRFLSPAFTYEKTGRILRLLGAGLVNRPALVMTALSRENSQMENDPMKAIAKALGLAEDADEAAILAALTARDTQHAALCTALKVAPADATQATLLAAVARLQTDAEAATAAARATPDMAALRDDLTAAKTALAALQRKDADREIDLALDRAAAQGKITPGSRPTYRALCQTEGGLARFTELVKTLPVIAEPSSLDGRPVATASEGVSGDPVEIAALARQYQAEQARAGRFVSASEAVVHVSQEQK